MARVASLWLPTWGTDRLRRTSSGLPADRPLITVAREGSRRLVAGADAAARAAGIAPGMTVALAQAMVPGITVAEADPDGDAAGLERLAVWCLRYAPIVAIDPPDGIVIDTAGAAHLFGGEAALITDLASRLAQAGIAARVALADTPAAAWGLARFAPSGTIAPPGAGLAVLSPLAIAALRLDAETVTALRHLGFDTVGDIAIAHRPSLALRFGPALTRRLDQARGVAAEPIAPVRPPEMPAGRLAFAEPLIHAGGLFAALVHVVEALCADLDAAGLVARRLDLLFHRVDGTAAALRVGSAKGTRDSAHITRLFGERLESVDPGFGVEAATLAATRTEPFRARQFGLRNAGWSAEVDDAAGDLDLGPLIDRIASRIGAKRLYRVAPVESDLPERAERLVSALAPPIGTTWNDGPRPALVLHPPEPVEVVALLPDHPPKLFVWRGRRLSVVRADGPERIHGEWWRSDDEIDLTRDYFRVEVEGGARYWLFRAGDGSGARWFCQGAFA